ncbi:MAG: polysaccharide biosynthesis/export family protein [Paludibacter sp.]|nr:polysaccharide biosynthesis/export family protein [Paludibacter sp.]
MNNTFVARGLFLMAFLFMLFINSNAQIDSTYIIKRGDVLQIDVMEHPEFSLVAVPVMPDGFVQFPGLGSIRAAGMTIKEFTTVMQKNVEKYVVNPVLTVFVKYMPSQVMNVVGYVNTPGQIQIFEPTDLITALSKAGGIKDIRRCKWVTIVRQDQSFEKYSVKKIFSKNFDRAEIPVLNVGDTVYVIEPNGKFNWSLLTFITQLAYISVLIWINLR